MVDVKGLHLMKFSQLFYAPPHTLKDLGFRGNLSLWGERFKNIENTMQRLIC